MNTSIKQRIKEQGNIILVALIISGVAGVTLASYLVMAQQQNTSIYRSQNWNAGMAVTEAGIEDGLQLINRFAGTFDDISKWTNYALLDGWDGLGSVYHIHRSIGDNSYDTYITNSWLGPTVTCIANVPWTYMYASQGGLPPIFAQVNGTVPAPPLTRRVYVQTKKDSLFTVAMAALQTIDLKGNNIMTDSFDSSDPNYSTNGLYPSGILSMTKANGDVCTDLSIVDSLNVGNADIKGHIRTGPGLNTYSIGANGSVGDRPWVESGTLGIKPGWATTDFNVLFPSVKLPVTTWLPAASGNYTVDGIQYGYVFTTSGDYYINGSLGGNNNNIYIGTNANVRLKFNGAINSSSLIIRICPANAYLQVFETSSGFSLSGSAMIDNMSGHPDRFYLFGTDNCTSISYAGNGNFYGCVYAPNAVYTLGGGGSDTWDFVGSSVTRTVVMNGHYNFHFDENLRNVGPSRGYIVNSWKEVAANQ